MVHMVCLAGANIGLVLISQVAWDSGLFESETLRTPRPLHVAFPAYEDDVVIKVFSPLTWYSSNASWLLCFM